MYASGENGNGNRFLKKEIVNVLIHTHTHIPGESCWAKSMCSAGLVDDRHCVY